MSATSIDQTEIAIVQGVVRALRKRAAAQAKIAKDSATPAGDKFPGVFIRQGESALAHRLAIGLSRIADELSSEGAI